MHSCRAVVSGTVDGLNTHNGRRNEAGDGSSSLTKNPSMFEKKTLVSEVMSIKDRVGNGTFGKMKR